MKELLTGLLILGSFSVLASDIRIGGYAKANGETNKFIVSIEGDKGFELYELLDIEADAEGTKRGKSITCFSSGICLFDINSKGKIKHTNH